MENGRLIKIDLEKVIGDKNPKLLKLLPGFIIRYLKRIIHQDEINDFLKTNHNLYGLDFTKAVLDRFGVKIKIIGSEHIPENGRILFAANHPLGGLDGVALIWTIGQKLPNVLFPVNDILMNLPNLRELFIPINKHGSNLQNAKIIENTFAGDHTMLYFPAGLCSRKLHGEIIDMEWKKTFVNKARKHKRDILPVHISGKNSNFFYNLANIRKKLGIKINIEMLYLVDEMFKQKDKDLVITFGQPIPYSTLDKSKTDRAWAKIIKRKVYQLGETQQTEK
ncbi:MAG: 1-acyl-sn-glycerol-3-phosphate acyltransferase [Bacteroidales bacterium]|nr:1-acyl-sn-glycerol-3-phosphate acyltransferase [Bacteroidales bacterium]